MNFFKCPYCSLSLILFTINSSRAPCHAELVEGKHCCESLCSFYLFSLFSHSHFFLPEKSAAKKFKEAPIAPLDFSGLRTKATPLFLLETLIYNHNAGDLTTATFSNAHVRVNYGATNVRCSIPFAFFTTECCTKHTRDKAHKQTAVFEF